MQPAVDGGGSRDACWRSAYPRFPSPRAFLQGKRLVFVTNNSTKSRQGYTKKFQELGLNVTAVRGGSAQAGHNFFHT